MLLQAHKSAHLLLLFFKGMCIRENGLLDHECPVGKVRQLRKLIYPIKCILLKCLFGKDAFLMRNTAAHLLKRGFFEIGR